MDNGVRSLGVRTLWHVWGQSGTLNLRTTWVELWQDLRGLSLSVWVRLQNRLVLGGFSGGSRGDLGCVFLGQELV